MEHLINLILMIFILVGIVVVTEILSKHVFDEIEKFNNKQITGVILLITSFSFILFAYEKIVPYFYTNILKHFLYSPSMGEEIKMSIIIFSWGFGGIFLTFGVAFFTRIINKIKYKGYATPFFFILFMILLIIISHENYIEIFK